MWVTETWNLKLETWKVLICNFPHVKHTETIVYLSVGCIFVSLAKFLEKWCNHVNQSYRLDIHIVYGEILCLPFFFKIKDMFVKIFGQFCTSLPFPSLFLFFPSVFISFLTAAHCFLLATIAKGSIVSQAKEVKFEIMWSRLFATYYFLLQKEII